MNDPSLDGRLAEELLKELAKWGPVCVIVFSGGSVFEYKGPFPAGQNGHGYYNLQGIKDSHCSFEGHLKLDAVSSIALVDKPHRGKRSLSLVFEDDQKGVIFKIFVGRDPQGELIDTQVAAFENLVKTYGQL